ncbi:MAG: hypothetical protein SangKO_088870 [Sandaracinaceae bacterium]
MRILAIRGENLASLEGAFEISLAEGPLAQAGVFAICGATGAGKSTLLDAMCLALFDTAPRLNGRGRSRVGREDGDQLTLTDPRSLLRKGAGAGHAEVEFEGADGRVYRARWEARRARKRADGNLQPSTMTLLDVAAEKPLGDKKTEVKQAVERALGLTFDQFRRSVLLAQGDFAAFLDADPKERADLLERMTGTEIYGVISMEAHARLSEERRRLEALEQRVGEVRPLAETERAQLEGQREGLLHRRAEDQLSAANAAHAVRWHAELAGLKREEREALDAHRAVERQLALAETKRAELAAVEAALPLAPVVDAADRAARLLAQRVERETQSKAAHGESARAAAAAAAAAKAARDEASARESAREAARESLARARSLDAELARQTEASAASEKLAAAASEARTAAVDKHEALVLQASAHRAAADAARDALERSAAHALLAQGWDRYEPELRQLAEVAGSLRALSDDWRAAKSARASRELDVAAAEGRLRGLAARRHEARAEWESLQAEVRAEPSAALVEVQAEWNRERTALETLIGVATRAQSAHDEELRQRRLAETARERAAAAEAQAARAEVSRATAEARRVEAERSRDALRAALDLGARRGELRDGEPCPLCGSEAHPWAERDPVIDAHLAAEEERLVALRAELADATRAVAELGSAARGHRTNAEAADAEARRWASSLAALRDEYRQAAEGLERDDEAWPDELPETPVDLPAPDWGPLFELANVTPTGGVLLAEGARAALEESKREAEKKLRELEAEEKKRRRRERHAEALRASFEEAREAEDAARREREETLTRLREAAAREDELAQRHAHATETRGTLVRGLRAPLEAFGAWEARLSSDGEADSVETCVETFVETLVETFVESVREAALARLAHERALADALEAERALGPSLVAAREQRTAAEARAAERGREAEAARAALLALGEARAALFDGRPVAEVEAGLTAAWEGARAQAEASAEAAQQAGRVDAERQAQSEQAASARAEAELEASQSRERLATALAEASLDEAGVRARLAHDPREVDSWRRELSTLDASRAELSAICAERTRKRQEHEEREPPRLGADAAQEALGAAERRRRETEALLQGVHLRLSRDDEDREKAAALTKELEAQRGQMEVWQTLAELIGSASGNKLRVFAQSLTLELLLDHANHHLRDLAPRYSLSRVPGEDLALQVVDHEMGDEVRAASSLSGGESFLVALGLALGLASLSARKASVGSLFIDEGFGALDPASLEMVLSSLDALQATGRQVGLISHVPTIAERFDTRVQVVAAGPARSRVEIVVGF